MLEVLFQVKKKLAIKNIIEAVLVQYLAFQKGNNFFLNNVKRKHCASILQHD